MTEPLSAGVLPSPPLSNGTPSAFSQGMEKGLEKIRSNPLLSRAALPVAIGGGLGALALGWLIFAQPGREPLYSQLPDSDKAAVVSALETAGLEVALDPRTGAVLLPPDDHARARMLLASQGLPKAATGGLEMITDLPLGTSRAIESARLKSAQERDLAASIEALEGVESARVLIARPEASPFVRDRAPVTASVTLTLAAGRTLSDQQSRAIIHLVAGAVSGLSPDNVAIADQSGLMLAGEPGAGRMQPEDRRLKMQADMEARSREAILRLLTPLVGAENLTAQVSIDLDFAAREQAEERYDPAGALRSEQVNRQNSSEPRAIGIPGALSNTIPAAPNITGAPPVAAPPSQVNTGAESATRNYELGRSVEVTTRNGSQIRRLTAAVAISADALGPAAGRAQRLAEIRSLVEGAVGYHQERGDLIAVTANSFVATTPEEQPFWKDPVVLESSKWLGGALVLVALLAFLVRPLMKRLMAERAERRAVQARQKPIDLTPVTVEPLSIDYSEKLAETRLLAASDAARATAVARRLLAEEAA